MGLFFGTFFFSLAITRLDRKLGLNLFPQTVLCPIRHNVDPLSYDILANRTIHAFPHLGFPNLSVSSPSAYCRNLASLRSMAVLSVALLSGEAAIPRARTSGKRGGFSLFPPQSPRSFTALAHLGLFARQTKTAILRRLKSDQCSTPLLHVGFGVCFDVSVGLDYGDTGFKADVENT